MPANVKFEVDDAEDNWTFQHQFDFVHCRYLAAAMSDWEKLVRQCFEATKPGGYTEFQEYNLRVYSEDGSLTSEHAERKWNDLGCDACISFGKDPEPGPKIEGWMKGAGFADVYHERIRLPIGPWPKDKHLVSSCSLLRDLSEWAHSSPENSRCMELGNTRRRTRRNDPSPVDASTRLEARRSARSPCGCSQGFQRPQDSCSARLVS